MIRLIPFPCATLLYIGLLLGSDVAVNAQDSSATSAPLPPQPGPDLLNFTAEEIESAYRGQHMPEAIRMYLAIAKGDKMDGSSGWFGPAQTRFTWDWLRRLHGDESLSSISSETFVGKSEAFQVLDRNHDGNIEASDLNWSDDNAWVQQSYIINRLFRRIDQDGDGQVNESEWSEFYERATDKSGALSFELLRDGFLSRTAGTFRPGDAPTKEILISGLMKGEIGSLQEGPDVGDVAPEFELPLADGSGKIRLSEMIQGQPVVLVFGNFTCGPFRSMYPGVDTIASQYATQANFLAVYVREAHPTDGWSMSSNQRAGISVSQPTTFDERRSVATTCASKLNMSIPLVVDDLHDTAGNAYSGMPARLYVIDANGRIAYKSGRGPFGFKSGEMEQALQMAILEAEMIEGQKDDSAGQTASEQRH